MDSYQGRPLNAPNDVVVASDGSVWFTDQGYGILSDYEGRHPEEMFGRSRFPRIGSLPYLLTLAPRGFFWFRLVSEEENERNAS